jgi:GT2 family glycosyltransferase
VNELSQLPASSLIICSRDRPKLLLETVESILRGDNLPTEMVIIDQSMEFHPALSATKSSYACNIRYIHSRTVGVGRARNLGIASSQYPILIFIDDDMFVEPDWFGNMVDAVIKAGPHNVVTGQVLAGESEVHEGSAPSIKSDREPAVYKGRLDREVLFTGNMGAYHSAFEDVGVFDERLGPGTLFPSSEDNDLCFRLLEHGYCIHYVPDAIVYHRAWRSRNESLTLEWRYGIGRGAYYAKHMRIRDTYMLWRMARDIWQNSAHFFGVILRKHQMNLELLIAACGVFYGAIRWGLTQTGRSGS